MRKLSGKVLLRVLPIAIGKVPLSEASTGTTLREIGYWLFRVRKAYFKAVSLFYGLHFFEVYV